MRLPRKTRKIFAQASASKHAADTISAENEQKIQPNMPHIIANLSTRAARFFRAGARKIFAPLFAASLLCPAAGTAGGYDFSALLKPDFFRNVDTRHHNAAGNPVFDIAFEKISVGTTKTAFNVSIPSKLVIKNLSLAVYAKNLDDSELAKTEYPRPFEIEIESLNLKIVGGKKTMIITASGARVGKDNVVYLSADAKMSVGANSAELGYGSTLSLDGRLLIVKSSSAGNLGIKF